MAPTTTLIKLLYDCPSLSAVCVCGSVGRCSSPSLCSALLLLYRLNLSGHTRFLFYKCNQFDVAGTLLLQGQPVLKLSFFQSRYLPKRKAFPVKQWIRAMFGNSLKCRLLPQPIDHSAWKGRFIFRKTTLLLGTLTWCCELLTFHILLVNSHLLFH